MEEQFIREMQEELRSMTEALLRLSANGLKINDQRLVAAIGQLAKTTGSQVKSVKNFIRDVDQAAKSFGSAAKSVEEFDSQLDQAAETAIRREQRRTLDDQRWRTTQARSVNTLSKQMWEMSDRSEAFGQKLLLAQQALSGLASIGGATTRFAVGLTDGNRSFESLNPVVDSVTNAISNLAQAVPLLGGALSGAARGIGEAAKFAMSNLQKTVVIFEDLGAAGALTATGMTGVQQQFTDSMMTMEGFKSTVITNAAALARFGGTVGTGTTRFAKFVGEIQRSEVGEQLRQLGFNADTIGETAAAFVTQQTRLGLGQRKTNEQLAQGAAQYARELDALAKLTGMQRKEIQAQQDAALSESRFRAQYDEMVATGQERQAKAMLDFQTMLSQASPEMAQGFRDISAGFVNTEAAQKLFRSTSGDAAVIMERLKTGQIDQVTAFRQLQGSLRDNLDTQRNLAKATGDATGAFSKYAEVSDVVNAKIVDGAVEVERTQKKQASGEDELTKKTTEARKSMDEIANKITEFGFALTRDAAPAVAAFTDSLNKVVDFVADTLGVELRQSRERRVHEQQAAQERAAANQAMEDIATGVSSATPPAGGEMAGNAVTRGIGTALRSIGLGPRAGGTGGYASQDDLAAMGLQIKQGDVQQDQARVSPKLLDLAKKIQSDVPGFSYFSGFNDRYHQERAPGSRHVRGMALDFTVAQYDPKQAEQIITAIKSMGASRVIDEYANPSPNSTGGHFHVEIPEFRDGGVARGPNSGYLAALHGNEAVIPLPDGISMPQLAKLDSAIKAGPISSYRSNLADITPTAPETSRTDSTIIPETLTRDIREHTSLLSTQLAKLDDILSVMRSQTAISSKMLQVSQN
jgi:hypothetical protein